MEETGEQQEYVVCIKNDDYPASLELRKIYQVVPDAKGVEHALIRVIDESGEDYLYPANYFAPIDVPQAVAHLFAIADQEM